MVSHAPFPDDVNWRDIAFDMNLLWLRKMIISFILFIIFFFLSTPAFLLKIFDLIATKELIKKGILKPVKFILLIYSMSNSFFFCNSVEFNYYGFYESISIDVVGRHFAIDCYLCLSNDSI